MTGVLENHVPGDPVEDALHNGDFDVKETPIERRLRYNKTGQALGVGLPAFYFSIGPLNQFKGTNIADLRIKNSQNTWLVSHDYKTVGDYFSLLVAYLDQIPDTLSKTEQLAIYSALTSIAESPPSGAINQSKWEQLPVDWIPKIQNQRQDAVESGVSFWNSVPGFQWHGFQNSFHQRIINFIKGDWGKSKIDSQSVSKKIKDALLWTVTLSVFSLLLSFLLALLLGQWAILNDRKTLEKTISTLLFAGYAIPIFWLATLLIVFFTSNDYGSLTNIFPGVGVIVVGHQSVFYGMLENGDQLILPILCMSIGTTAYFYQFILTGQRKEKTKPYVVTALSKGLPLSKVLTSHTLLNTLYPLIGLLALIIPGLIGGAIIIEVLFNIPGMGRLLFNSIQAKDWNVVVAIVFLTGIIAFLAMMCVDIIMHYINPKLQADG